MRYQFSRAELKQKAGREFADGDTIRVSKYAIHIVYGPYPTPALRSWVENTRSGEVIGCWPVGARNCWPYFIDDFLGRKSIRAG